MSVVDRSGYRARMSSSVNRAASVPKIWMQHSNFIITATIILFLCGRLMKLGLNLLVNALSA